MLADLDGVVTWAPMQDGASSIVQALDSILEDVQMIVRATVRNGRFVIDAPADLPEGSVVDMLIVEEPFEAMPADERAALLAQIDRGIAAIGSGEEGVDADDVLRAIAKRSSC